MERSCYDSDDDDEIDNNNGGIKNEEKLLILNKNVGLIEDDVSLHAHSFTPETSPRNKYVTHQLILKTAKHKQSPYLVSL